MKNTLSSPRGAQAFHELRKYHTRPLRLNWDPNINVRFFIFCVENLKNYQAQLFYVLSFPLGYLKTAQKTVQSSKNAEK